MDRPLVAVVLAGGIGTRLYPAARPDRPKQFLEFGGEQSLLARTVDRAAFADRVVVSTRPAFADRISEHAPDADVLVEAAPRDTGPALVQAAHELQQEEEDQPVLLCLPSDHAIDGAFEPTARAAATLAAETGDLVTMGIDPERPAAGYGYLLPGDACGADGVTVERFIEKPDADRAAELVEDGALWNAGVFAWTPEALLREVRDSELAPLLEALEAGEPAAGFAAVDAVSIDESVLEGSDRVAAVRAEFSWDDLGAWDAVGRQFEGPLAETLEIDASGNVLASAEAHITVVGASDLVVAAYDDRVLVVPVDRAEEVRSAVEQLREQARF
ncbi:MAG: sugar phosphate nucleotidyltransferase [Halobacteriales archaeon]